MKASRRSEVRQFYDETADSYAQMMDAEIDLPMYRDVLGRLAKRLVSVEGGVLDTSCGTGHMLARYREQYDPDRSLVGVDLSDRMVRIAQERLGSGANVYTGDMAQLKAIDTESVASVWSFFALHHLDPAEIPQALQEWRRVLRPGGQLVLATWEGTGPIDYGDHSSVVALRYQEDEVREWLRAAGFVLDRCVVDPVEGLPMDAVYAEGTRP